MSNVYSFGQTCQYLVSRAARHRRAGRYDKAIALLTSAVSQYGRSEEIDLEMAAVYDEMGCEEEAGRYYLRIARGGGTLRAQALFQLSISAAQHGDLERAASYYQAFASTDGEGISAHMAQLLGRQLHDALNQPPPATRKARAKAFRQRAVQGLHSGRLHAALRAVGKAQRLNATSDGAMLHACCLLMLGRNQEAEAASQAALDQAPNRIQAMCIRVDTLAAVGRREEARKLLIRAAMRANATDSLFSAAVECAKYGEDVLTLILTRRILKREPYHLRAMAMRACAFANLGKLRQAERLFARLTVLLPDNSVYDAHYRRLSDGLAFDGRLFMAQDVTQEEGMERCMALASMLHRDPAELKADRESMRILLRYADWAMHSAEPGAQITLMAIIMLGALDTEETRELLLDALVDPVLDDGTKKAVLQVFCMHCSGEAHYADLSGRFVRLAAGAAMPRIQGEESSQEVVQRAADALMHVYPDAPQALLSAWVSYLNVYGSVSGRRAAACSAALEYVYHLQAGRRVSIKAVARRHGVSARLTRLCAGRILRAQQLAPGDAQET